MIAASWTGILALSNDSFAAWKASASTDLGSFRALAMNSSTIARCDSTDSVVDAGRTSRTRASAS